MKTTSNQDFALRERSGLADDDARQPDWNELRARFDAAHEARRILGNQRTEFGHASFDENAAMNLEGLAAVNRTDLANGKSIDGIVIGSASLLHSGDRGL